MKNAREQTDPADPQAQRRVQDRATAAGPTGRQATELHRKAPRRKLAGSPQGLLPGAPTDPGVHVKCTRFVKLWHIAVPHTTWSFRGDTLVRHGVLGVVPTPRPQRGTPLAPRGPEGSFPRFEATMGHCDFLTAFSPRFVSFAWRYLGASALRPHRPQTHGRRIIPEFAVPVAPDPVFFKELPGSPTFP